MNEQIIYEHLGISNFYKIDKILLSLLGPEFAIYIGTLLDKRNYCYYKNQLQSDGSFYIKSEKLVKDLGMSRRKIQKCKKQLKEMNVLFTKLKGSPPKEYYKLDIKKLLDDIGYFDKLILPKSAEDILPRIEEDKLPKSAEDISNNNKYNKNKKNNKKHIVRDKKQSTDTMKNSIKNRNEKMKPIAKQLGDIIKTNRNIKIPKRKLDSWCNEIRLLNETDGIELKRIQTALDWYEKNIGRPYVPVIESGSSFRKKFLKLENAIERDEGINKLSKFPYEDPEEKIKNYFKSNKKLKPYNYKNKFIKKIYQPAKKLLKLKDEDSLDVLSDYLINMLLDMRSARENISPKIRKVLFSEFDAIEDFIQWLNSNSNWITEVKPKVFNIESPLFKKFVYEKAKYTNGRHIITGEYI